MAKSRTTTESKEVKKLKEQNARLKAELQKSKKSTKQPKKARFSSDFWRTTAVVFLSGLAGAVLVTGNLLFWTGRTITDNQRYTTIVSNSIKEPEIQQAVASYATTQIFQNVDIQQTTKDVLPPRAEFLAPAISSQVQNITNQSIQKLLASPKFQELWINVNSTAHEKLINYIANYQGNGEISINDLYAQISKTLGDTQLSFLANKQLPKKVGQVTVADAPWLPIAHNIVSNLALYRNISMILLVCTVLLAAWAAQEKRKFLIRLGIIFVVLMALSLTAIRVTQSVAVQAINPQYQEAVKEFSNIVIQSLLVQTRAILIGGALLAFIPWISGPFKPAKYIRERFVQLFNGNLHSALFGNKENKFTLTLARSKRTIQWAWISLLAIIILFMRNLTPTALLGYGLLMVLGVAIIELLSAQSIKSGK